MRITWLGHSSVKIEVEDKTIYVDPYAGEDEWYTKASIVLISQYHYDHCNLAKLARLRTDATHVLGTRQAAANTYPCGIISVGERRTFDDIEVIAGPARNTRVKQRGHEHEQVEMLSFAIIAEKKTLFFLGDSDFMNEFIKVKPDVLLVPVGGTYTMNAKDAARAAELIDPKYAIPIHWGSVNGSRDDAELFKELCKVPVIVLKPGEGIEI